MLTRGVEIKEVKWMGKTLYAKKGRKAKIAIRLFCSECMGLSRTEANLKGFPQEDIKGCTDEMCPLFEWRLGKNPHPSKSRVEKGRVLAHRTQVDAQKVGQISMNSHRNVGKVE
jgi:hypothetical protein